MHVPGQTGVYTTLGGSLRKVIDLNDTLDGKSISSFEVRETALSGDSIAIEAHFDDGSVGIYVATAPVPEPSSCSSRAVCA